MLLLLVLLFDQIHRIWNRDKISHHILKKICDEGDTIPPSFEQNFPWQKVKFDLFIIYIDLVFTL